MMESADRAKAAPPDARVERGRGTRERLIATARKRFGEHGYEGTSIGAVLEAAGVARGALYHHFDSKEALFDAVLDQLVAEIAATTAEAGRAATEPLEALRAGSFAWLEAALDPAVQRIALLDAPGVVGWRRWREIDEQHILGGLRAALEAIAAEGGLPRENTALLAHMVLAAVNEAALMIARSEEPKAALEAGKATVDMVLNRLAGHSERRASPPGRA